MINPLVLVELILLTARFQASGACPSPFCYQPEKPSAICIV
jgi:hypothetical protein